MVMHTPRPSRGIKPVHLADPTSMYTVLKLLTQTDEENPRTKVSVRGVHTTEEQAYTAAILDLIYDLEVVEGNMLPKLRAIAKTNTLPLKDRLKSIQSCQDPDETERVEFIIKKTQLFPEEDLKMDSLLEAPLMPCTYWDSSDEEDYDPSEDDDEDEDEDGEEDLEMEDEDEDEERVEGVESSGSKPME
eukprot:Gb_23771 [translate_table: standard]